MRPIKKYECTACGDILDTEDEAANCRCHGTAEWFRCPVCGCDYDDESECERCIDSHGDAAVVMVSSAELEAAGQQRLLP